MSLLPPGLDQSFAVAAGELGMCCAAWLYVTEVAEALGVEGVGALRDELGRSFPVLDAVAEQWLGGGRAPQADAAPVLALCATARVVVVVGLEATFLDRLVEGLGDEVRCALVCASDFDVDWERVLANYGGRVERASLETFQSFAGPDSVLVTFAYGAGGGGAHVLPTWLRVTGEDVRTQFRSLVAWDVLAAPMFVYPRWLVEVSTGGFTHVVR